MSPLQDETLQEEVESGAGNGVIVASDPPHPHPHPHSHLSLRSIDLDVADLWCHSLLEQRMESSNIEAMFGELEKIIPRLIPLRLDSDEEDNDDDTGEDCNPTPQPENAGSMRRVEDSVVLRMRMLEVWQDVLTLEFQEADEWGTNDDDAESPPLMFPTPEVAAQDVSRIRDRLRLLFEKMKARRGRNDISVGNRSSTMDEKFSHLQQSLLTLQEVLEFEVRLANSQNSTQQPESRVTLVEELSDMMKSWTKSFLDTNVPVPDELAAVTAFVLQLVASRQTRTLSDSPPSPYLASQEEIQILHSNSNDDEGNVSDKEVEKIQRGLRMLYAQSKSPFHVVKLQSETRQVLVHWSRVELELPKLWQLGYMQRHEADCDEAVLTHQLHGQKVQVLATTKQAGAAAGLTNNHQSRKGTPTQPSSQDDSEATLLQSQDSNSKKPGHHHDSDSETTFGETNHKKKPTSSFKETTGPATFHDNQVGTVDRIWGIPKNQRDSNRQRITSGITVAARDDDDETNAMEKKSHAAHKPKHKTTSKRTDPPEYTANSTGISSRYRPLNLKPPPQYGPERKQSETIPQMLPVQATVKANRNNSKRKGTSNHQTTTRQTSEPTQPTRNIPGTKRKRSNEHAIAAPEVRTKQKTKGVSKKPTETDIVDAIRKGIYMYGRGNWTMIQKKSGVLKHLTRSEIMAKAQSVSVLAK